MKFVDEFREPEIITRTSEQIRRLADPNRHYRIMEVCGGHTHAIYRFGLKDLLPANIELIHGPGCPVCVLPMGRIDDGLSIAHDPNIIFAAFGDMMRVPGTQGSPLEHKARGMDVRIVYSPSDALKLAQLNPDKHVMFFAIGFETTAPSTALTLVRARAQSLHNFSVFCNHVTIIPAIRAILDSPDMRIDAFIGPGHVSTVIGCRPYEWIARNENKPVAVSGFEPLDILQSIVMVLRQLRGDLFFQLLERVIGIGAGERVEDDLDPRERLAAPFERHQGVVEGGRAGVVGDGLDFGDLLAHARLEGRREVGVLDLVKRRRRERQGDRREQRVCRRALWIATRWNRAGPGRPSVRRDRRQDHRDQDQSNSRHRHRSTYVGSHHEPIMGQRRPSG